MSYLSLTSTVAVEYTDQKNPKKQTRYNLECVCAIDFSWCLLDLVNIWEPYECFVTRQINSAGSGFSRRLCIELLVCKKKKKKKIRYEKKKNYNQANKKT